jgi:hypothetical protein
LIECPIPPTSGLVRGVLDMATSYRILAAACCTAFTMFT